MPGVSETYHPALFSKPQYRKHNNECMNAETCVSFELYRIQGHLGSGQFGSVEKGLWRAGAKGTPVALKLLKEGSSKENKVKFLQEAAIMAQFRHPNVVSLYGVVSNTEPVS